MKALITQFKEASTEEKIGQLIGLVLIAAVIATPIIIWVHHLKFSHTAGL